MIPHRGSLEHIDVHCRVQNHQPLATTGSTRDGRPLNFPTSGWLSSRWNEIKAHKQAIGLSLGKAI